MLFTVGLVRIFCRTFSCLNLYEGERFDGGCAIDGAGEYLNQSSDQSHIIELAHKMIDCSPGEIICSIHNTSA